MKFTRCCHFVVQPCLCFQSTYYYCLVFFHSVLTIKRLSFISWLFAMSVYKKNNTSSIVCSICLSTYLCICLPVCLSACLSVWLSDKSLPGKSVSVPLALFCSLVAQNGIFWSKIHCLCFCAY